MQIRRIIHRVLLVSCMSMLQACSAFSQTTVSQPTRETYQKLAAEVEAALHTDVLGVWFPRSVDREHGGFHSHFTREWEWAPGDGKFSVFQGRMTWVASQVILREPKLKDEYLPIAVQGIFKM